MNRRTKKWWREARSSKATHLDELLRDEERFRGYLVEGVVDGGFDGRDEGGNVGVEDGGRSRVDQ